MSKELEENKQNHTLQPKWRAIKFPTLDLTRPVLLSHPVTFCNVTSHDLTKDTQDKSGPKMAGL
jgi:hypothetical protein